MSRFQDWITSVSVSPANFTMTYGATAPTQLTAAVTPSKSAGGAVAWSTSDTTVATVDTNGFVTAVGPGTASITAKSAQGSKTGSSQVTVLPTLTVSPSTVSLDQAQKNFAVLTLSTSPASALTSATFKWNSSNSAAATVSSTGPTTATVTSGPALTAATPAVITATCTVKGVTTAATVQVQYLDQSASATTVLLNFSTLNVVAGTSQPLQATPHPANATLTWSSSNTSIVTVDNTGLVKAVGTGGQSAVVTVSATANGQTASATCTVNVAAVPVRLTAVTVAPKTLTLDVFKTTSARLTAALAPANATGVSLAWSSSNSQVASVDPNSGQVTAVAPGVATITVAANNPGPTLTDTCTVTVNPYLTLTPTTPNVGHSSTDQIKAAVYPASAPVTWTLSGVTATDTTISPTGLLTSGTTDGAATVTATTTVNGQSASASVTIHVATVPINGMVVTPAGTAFEFTGATTQTVQFTATVLPTGSDQTVTWISANPAVFKIDTNGLATAVGPGTTQLTVTTRDGSFSVKNIQVVVNPVVTLTPAAISKVLPSAPVQVAATTYPAGLKVSWSSLNSAVATVDQTGLVTFVSPGQAYIQAKVTANYVDSDSTSCMVTVTNPMPAVSQITVVPPSAQVIVPGTGPAPTPFPAPMGTPVQMTAAAWAGGPTPTSYQQISPTIYNLPFVWSSSNQGTATIDPATGIVTPVNPGTTTITASLPGVTPTASLVVNVIPSVTISNQVLNINAPGSGQYNITVNPASSALKWSLATPPGNPTLPLAITVGPTGVVTAPAPPPTLTAPFSWGVSVTAGTAPYTNQSTLWVNVTPTAAPLVLSQSALGVIEGTSDITLEAIPPNPSVVWSAPGNPVATVTTGGTVSFHSAGTTTLTATLGSATQTCTVTVRPAGSTNTRVGFNIWNIGWDGMTNYFQAMYVSPGPSNWTGVTNPWNPQFLTDCAAFSGPIRFMDTGSANGPWINWSDRIPQSANPSKPFVNYIDPSIQKYFGTWTNKNTNPPTVTVATTFTDNPLAYEWMIDLCNRTGRDMWVNIPFATNPDFWLQLVNLINTQLHPGIKVFVEYSNEVWNGMECSFGYAIDQGVAAGLPGQNFWYQGEAWALYRALQIFDVFQKHLSDPTRLVRVYAGSGGNSDLARTALQQVLGSSQWNPLGQGVDLLAIAPYMGPADASSAANPQPDIMSDDPNIDAIWKANVDWNYTNFISPYMQLAAAFHIPLGCYEGGQQLDDNTIAGMSNKTYFNTMYSHVYAAYQYMLQKWESAHFTVFPHYTIYSGAWGLSVAPPLVPQGTAPGTTKAQALVDWVASHP